MRRKTSRRLEGQHVLTVDQMYQADAAAIASGIDGITLMENASAAVARAITARWSPRPTLVLCGPGNNGGDGFGVALELRRARWPVTLALLGDRAALKGGAAIMAERWPGSVEPLEVGLLAGDGLVVDALFGAGLARPIGGVAGEVISAVAERGLGVVAIDVPSGVDGDTGAVNGVAAPADITVTFFRPKPGHLLMPGRALRGDLVVADIGIPPSVLDDIAPTTRVNGPRLWGDRIPWPAPDGHKYQRGHAVVVGGETTTGAARLAARAALRAGAGLVTVAAPGESFGIYAAALTSVMVASIRPDPAFRALLDDPRKNAFLIGPGNGVSEQTAAMTLAALKARKKCVLDADALTSFAGAPDALFAAIGEGPGPGACVLTPHDGEYARLFGLDGDRVSRARAAAERVGAVVLLKGPESVIAAPDGRTAISVNGPPTLATAGTGDVLAGFVVGLMAAGVDGFDAACMASWLHGETAHAVGPGMISEDLADRLPDVFRQLRPTQDWS